MPVKKAPTDEVAARLREVGKRGVGKGRAIDSLRNPAMPAAVRSLIRADVKAEVQRYLPDCYEFLGRVVRDANDPAIKTSAAQENVAFKAAELMLAYAAGKPGQELTLNSTDRAFLWEHPAVRSAVRLADRLAEPAEEANGGDPPALPALPPGDE